MVCFQDLLNLEPAAATIPPLWTIDKNGRFYHVVQRASNKDNIYDKEVALYRENLLCRICAMYDITILFSVVMKNHSHDIVMADNWELISKATKQVNSAVSKQVRKIYSKRYHHGRRVFASRPYYRPIHDIVDLHVVSKYTFDNVAKVEGKGGYVPYSCFWNMENGIVSRPYNKELYPVLFGMPVTDLCKLFKQNDISTIRRMAIERFSNWTKLDNDRLFKVKPEVPWVEMAGI